MKLVARIAEIRMNRAQIFLLSLAAVLAGPVHAQVCSGGNDGGIDATGNQCSTFDEFVAVTTASAITPPGQLTKLGSVPASPQRRAICLAQVSSQKSTSTAIAVPASRQVAASARPSVSAKSEKIALGSEAFCSGGASGGMDVNGAECGEALATEISLVAQRNVR